MSVETWGWIASVSAVATVFWLAGFGASSEHEYSCVGWIVGAISMFGLGVSVMVLAGWTLVK